MIRYLKFMLKRRTASAGFFSQSGTINISRVLHKNTTTPTLKCVKYICSTSKCLQESSIQ
ncbi:hypothetical protein [Candidatus Tisiphia endosymbiont of Parasteatoda lunata]|uniref:hypothetical protein n=1 Tax=Candidatus Tisiphia endosymbiont of Parasteatoda lunata TaxID=3066275 RepID=UPI00313EED28